MRRLTARVRSCVSLCAPRSSRDLDTRRVEHQGHDPRRRASALQPEAVAARIVTQHDRRIRRQGRQATVWIAAAAGGRILLYGATVCGGFY